MSELLAEDKPVSTAALHREQAMEEWCNPNCCPPSCRWCKKAATKEITEMSQRVAQKIALE